jgi:hypothetical protein
MALGGLPTAFYCGIEADAWIPSEFPRPLDLSLVLLWWTFNGPGLSFTLTSQPVYFCESSVELHPF